MNNLSTPRTRFAPSPTGYLHIGSVWQALMQWLFIRHHHGQFVLRIEDTDRARFVADAEERIYETLEWFKIDFDEGPHIGGQYGPYRQSERLELYENYAAELVGQGNAYYCFCTSER